MPYHITNILTQRFFYFAAPMDASLFLNVSALLAFGAVYVGSYLLSLSFRGDFGVIPDDPVIGNGGTIVGSGRWGVPTWWEPMGDLQVSDIYVLREGAVFWMVEDDWALADSFHSLLYYSNLLLNAIPYHITY